MSEKIFNRIRLLRQEKGISRQSLAGAVGVNFQTIGYLERGEYNPSMKLAFKISRYFDLPVEAIFSDEPFESLTEILKRENE
ncbi:MAG: helix-turn-helix transcriptional regulator [Candidatus Marinimicrobia bacterium]|nr:helix-turn-helix transcriptional regulator [Candidatus Neomarinimicrobiota bacterium]MBL7010012.1 helix-turn-helix transcriptional regulator [Candidatus Neomarinimicrobiota bacterium]MBL7029722.1 helix-turn-helix transcriptional regulator [Candidatus Neomarinimicrobiota bacterium]